MLYREKELLYVSNQLKTILKNNQKFQLDVKIFCYLINHSTLKTYDYWGSFFSKFDVFTSPSRTIYYSCHV